MMVTKPTQSKSKNRPIANISRCKYSIGINVPVSLSERLTSKFIVHQSLSRSGYQLSQDVDLTDKTSLVWMDTGVTMETVMVRLTT